MFGKARCTSLGFSCGSSPERLQLWNANAGTAELSGRRIAHRYVPTAASLTQVYPDRLRVRKGRTARAMSAFAPAFQARPSRSTVTPPHSPTSFWRTSAYWC